ncbi:hypothetical protein SUGI_0654970 [Cryptomeria japonica]|uniref:geraniol 8-hydroxylase-like n=2 Tax=Cryptomeria japonica TaxID=3369 RepID=UPI0024147828|nr:geraniol 8-hydroxylase-like [Cryptomeria japonica]XP_059078199.1 geraniol 8-hydroxylase-like [Cryptomeria japonica]GLJ32549.1 hypothetical protein SUGI_0654830 [Cryptomeria japonica]GLJ32550.1 hypothetical protein SUGI_0654840 [Cryptomeria japonica]GLJ32551.1 hypothetical protein SUGI_0654850 [Cryptomeria japonica]GLJ32552.1 hypothetical protein SUGI_0654860 [Cryptomeria japonica]GLJ32553.1 hypothetical protein SUGI_0654870 [Cryptomeria japonica]
MEGQWVIWLSALVSSVLAYFLVDLMGKRKKKSRANLPPGPPGWPIVGNLLQLGKKPNESLWALSQQYGPLMTLSLGMKTAVVVSSSEMAKEVLKIHDQNFAGRIMIEAAKVFSHHESSIAFAQYGDYWRKFRRIATTELFTPTRLQALQHLRRDQVSETIRMVFEKKGTSMNIAELVYYEGLNLMSNAIFSKNLFDPKNLESAELRNTFSEMVNLTGKPNLADFYPFLKLVDPQGVCRRLTVHHKRLHEYLDVFIQDRLEARRQGVGLPKEKDFLDILLDLTAHDFTLVNIRALLLELLSAGSDTTTTTIEWVMVELIANPYVMKKAQKELEEVIGLNRKVEESDIDRLPYLHAIVKEVFRLHPALPLALPHRADNSCEVAGYMIPKHAMVIVNLWAIGRDPKIWKEPLKFMPERFFNGENSKVKYKGQNFELIPFGAGRRICLGLPLAHQMVHFTIASLIHSFNWMLPIGMNYNKIDMSETFGIVLKKSKELHAIPTPRLPNHLY